MQRIMTDELDALWECLPPQISQPLREGADRNELLEIVMDLGRPPEARYSDREAILDPADVTQEDIDYVAARIGAFGDDNRAGIERTLHRISAIRNRQGRIVGLTCRIGRAVFGTIKIIEDLVGTGKSILLLGRPGVGKTTMLREVARVLADDMGKRVIIVDTSNEIAGDGDIPHPAIGHARRMQVKTPTMQHAVMIEAVENHMPEVIVIDEIGTELEAVAARTIAERGVQLIATAHGNTLHNLILNPTLSDLIGGIQTVTLGDEEARRRGTQKSILERKAPPTFDILVEIQSWSKVALHSDVASVVDATLRGRPISPEVRILNESGDLESTEPNSAPVPAQKTTVPRPAAATASGARVYPFGINRGRLLQAAREGEAPVAVVEDLANADVLVTLRSYFRRKPQAIRDAEARGIPIYVLKNNSIIQMQQCLLNISQGSAQSDELATAIQEAEEAIERVLSESSPVELSPQSSYIRRLQHQLAQSYSLTSQSTGREPFRRVRIFRGTNTGKG